MFIVGFLGVVGIVMFAMISGGGMAPFVDILSAVFVFGASFFAGLAMSKGKLDSNTIANTGDAAVVVGWLGFIIGLVLMSGDLNNLLVNDLLGSSFAVAFLTVLYGYFIKLICLMYSRSKE
jgi:flagellar motor component MotA